MAERNVKDLIGGAAIVAIGFYFALGALEYRLGTARAMGPGYLPLALGVTAILIGSLIAVSSFFRPGGAPSGSLRPLLAVLTSLGVFAVVMDLFGMVPAVFAVVTISALGDRTARLWSTLALAGLMTLGAWLIFSVGLGLPIPAIKGLW